MLISFDERKQKSIFNFFFFCFHRCETLLSEFLKAIKNDPNGTKMPEMCNILISHAQSNNTLIQQTAINWIREFVQLSGPEMLKYASGIFTAILPCLAYEGESRKGRFDVLLRFFVTKKKKIQFLIGRCKKVRSGR